MTQQLELTRVSTHISAVVMAWCRAHVEREFLMKDLAKFVADNTKGYSAPDSAGRILRDLRQNGFVSYEVVNRRQSLYHVSAVLQ